MGRGDLYIEQAAAGGLEVLHEVGEREFGSVGDAAEHRFSGEGGTDGKAEDSSDEILVVPDFDGMGEACLVEAAVSGLECWAEPGFGSFGCRFCAAVDDLVEGMVSGDGEFGVSDGLFEASADVKIFQRDDSAGVGAPPGDGRSRPGEDSVLVGRQDGTGFQVAVLGEGTPFWG